MIKIKDFNKAVNFIYKKAKENGIEIVQIDSSVEIIEFCGETHGCGTPIYAEINIGTGTIMLGRPLVEEDSFFNICADGTVVQISERDYDGDYYNYDDYDDIYYDADYDDDDIYDDEDEW